VVVCGRKFHLYKYVLVHEGVPTNYFWGVLRMGGRFAEEGEVQLDHLDELATKALPRFIDYIYTGKLGKTRSSSVLGGEEAVLILHLADYFGVPGLMEIVMRQLRDLFGKDPHRGLVECLPAVVRYRGCPRDRRHRRRLQRGAALRGRCCAPFVIGVR